MIYMLESMDTNLLQKLAKQKGENIGKANKEIERDE